jgi:acyl-CoA synthetase (AMP-forming)/AMP-acid ligase II
MELVTNAGIATVYALFRAQAEATPQAPAIRQGDCAHNYVTLLALVDRMAEGLQRSGITRGDRVAMLSENSIDYIALQLACAKLGAIIACQNWRLAEPELIHCLSLIDPALLLHSDRYATLAHLHPHSLPISQLAILGDDRISPETAAEPEDGLLILYTSGTTGLPKAAVISHRAEIARMCALRMDLGLKTQDAYVAWAPMFHMGGTEHSLATLMGGGLVIVTDGFDQQAMADAIAEHQIGWLILIPAMIEPLLEAVKARGISPKGVRVIGCMADLVPATTIVEATRWFNAPYLNTFGATETGMPPLSGDQIPVAVAPTNLGKSKSALTLLKLVDAQGDIVADGEVGEAWVRGPTLFSGYWNAPEVNAEQFQDGWFRMGDLFRRDTEGRYHFAGRSKYLIKSGGENIYPAEIERVLLADPRITEAVVVRQPDAKWGEIPVAVIATDDPSLCQQDIDTLCIANLARYKRPREVVILPLEDFPRSTSGKILRKDIEAFLAGRPAIAPLF